ncbi:glycine cleavage T C-terminal barrel domain-containing protein [Paenibacillus solisilvae]|uniref:Glycine cleavage T C-terminal barrel domain-containing protein n=1 Tax=Paenibacillus solisilvae TaxID=2486751 RepID=A0ABW0VVY2_9BACL
MLTPTTLAADDAGNYSSRRTIAYAWLKPEAVSPGKTLHVEYFGRRHPVTVNEEYSFIAK